MRQTGYLRCFTRWLRENKSRFPYEVTVIAKKNASALKFQGVCPELKISVYRNYNLYSVTASAIYQSEMWDLIWDLDLIVAKEGVYYYCILCDKAKRYKTKRELYIDHNFEPLVEWVCENLTPNNYLCFYGEVDSMTCARIEKSPRDKCVYSTPVVLDKSRVRS